MIKPFEPKTFNIGELQGISAKTMEEHLGLYQGYVKNFNAMQAELQKMLATPKENPHALAELERRLSFEFGGMRLHEYYFAQLEGGAQEAGGEFLEKVNSQFESLDGLKHLMKNIALMRGPGWAMLYYDKNSDQFLTGFSGEQHQGHFVTLPIILAIDVWEHAYILDQGAQGKGNYVDAFFANLNWKKVGENFADVTRG